MRKKGIGTTATWIAAILVISLASVFFIFAVLFLVKEDIVFGRTDTAIEIARDVGSNAFLEKNFNSFLNKKLEFEDEEVTILELTEKSPIEKGAVSDLFNQEAEKQFKILFPFPTKKWDNIVYKPDPDHLSGGVGQPQSIHPYWIKVLEIEKKIDSDNSQIFAFGGTDCEPFSFDSITLTRYTKNRKVVFCINKNYYETIEGQK